MRLLREAPADRRISFYGIRSDIKRTDEVGVLMSYSDSPKQNRLMVF